VKREKRIADLKFEISEGGIKEEAGKLGVPCLAGR
jgi:hypothetical protein